MAKYSQFHPLPVRMLAAYFILSVTLATVAHADLVNFNPDINGNLPDGIPSVAPPNGTIFDLTNLNVGTQVPPFGNLMAGDNPLTGGPCVGFITGELCGTDELGAGAGPRFWETVIQNQTAAPETFVVAFSAPGLAAWTPLTLNPNDWVHVGLVYAGPTQPLWAVASFLPFQIVMTTSIIDPPAFENIIDCSLDASCKLQFTDPGGTAPRLDGGAAGGAAVPEPGAFPLVALGLTGVWLRLRQMGRRRSVGKLA